VAPAQTLYDLMLLLRTDVPDEERAEILTMVEDTIERGGGEIAVRHGWGVRALTYEIRHRPDAEYHLFQFTGPAELLERLRYQLRIDDRVLRARIIKVAPGTPPPPEVRREPAAVEA
jgi:small subunit ribosomal protein S6